MQLLLLADTGPLEPISLVPLPSSPGHRFQQDNHGRSCRNLVSICFYHHFPGWQNKITLPIGFNQCYMRESVDPPSTSLSSEASASFSASFRSDALNGWALTASWSLGSCQIVLEKGGQSIGFQTACASPKGLVSDILEDFQNVCLAKNNPFISPRARVGNLLMLTKALFVLWPMTFRNVTFRNVQMFWQHVLEQASIKGAGRSQTNKYTTVILSSSLVNFFSAGC